MPDAEALVPYRGSVAAVREWALPHAPPSPDTAIRDESDGTVARLVIAPGTNRDYTMYVGLVAAVFALVGIVGRGGASQMEVFALLAIAMVTGLLLTAPFTRTAEIEIGDGKMCVRHRRRREVFSLDDVSVRLTADNHGPLLSFTRPGGRPLLVGRGRDIVALDWTCDWLEAKLRGAEADAVGDDGARRGAPQTMRVVRDVRRRRR